MARFFIYCCFHGYRHRLIYNLHRTKNSYFRVFNPAIQGAKFDPRGSYVRKWCPELAKLPDKWLHQPHNAPAEILRAAGVGDHYPRPVVSHTIAREMALEAFARMKGGAAAGVRAWNPSSRISERRVIVASRG